MGRVATWVFMVTVLLSGLGKAQNVTGTWTGTIDIPAAPLEVTVILEQRDGNWLGAIDIPAQDSYGLPLAPVLVERGAVTFTIADVPGDPTFDGLAEPDAIEGVFTQSGEQYDFRLERFTGLARETVLELGQRYSELFYAGEMALLRSYFSEAMLAALSEAALLDFAAQIEADAGTEQSVRDERVSAEAGFTVYERSATFEKATLIVRWVLDDKGVIEGFFIRPDASSIAPSKFEYYQITTKPRLPLG